MRKLLEIITAVMEEAFEGAGYARSYGQVSLSNRPDLCEYQCNGAMGAVKEYKKAPIIIAQDVVAQLENHPHIDQIEAIAPGFINITLAPEFVASYVEEMNQSERLGVEAAKNPETIILDYGGANVAKPLHVGHLRTAIIGECMKRLARFMGHTVISDVHLGDWGLQMGLIMMEVKSRNPHLPYFDESYTGEYPKEAPFTISELEEIYPTASGKSKDDPEFRRTAMEATFKLQKGQKGYTALWKHIISVSVVDLKKNYATLDVSFDLWNGESDAQPFIQDLIDELAAQSLSKEDGGALIVEVQEETDTKEIPPCIILKSDGASLYSTTDLATLIDRAETYNPDQVIYVVDKRQELHFQQVFRVAQKAKILKEDASLKFLGFGTMNGKDGKPFKTREGGVMRLEHFVGDICEGMYQKISENRTVEESEGRKIAQMVGLAAIKYGDLSNQAAKDYVFDVERFTSFEGNTGPYILYSIVRIKSILTKYKESQEQLSHGPILGPVNASEKALMLTVGKFNQVMELAMEDCAPHKICAYVYELAEAFNHFYHDTKILSEVDTERKASYISLLELTKRVLEQTISLLGFEAPERM